ncbi:unnamed protein product [Caenorhabditis angaria]|uniref:DUF38 domain-containing protein n=1 Tax=Caenorhabditis angaria TaxID=860376 RepID=A0A9P1IMV1_9PELO|nr:unnamed protein product [Caenorhabditis angaria]
MRFLLFLIFTGIFVVLADEHPRYTAAKLTDQLKNILESGGNAEVSQLFTDDVIVEECGEAGSLEYLEKKFKTLIPELSEVSLTVKFAYPIPYTNNSIQFSVDQVLMFKDAQKSENELVIFAKPEDENLEVYKIFEIRKTPCN